MAYASTYTVAQLARVLGVCRQTIRRKIDSGQLAATLDMGAYRITQDAVRDYLAAKGHSAESIDCILLQADEARVTDIPPGLGEMARMMGCAFRDLVVAGTSWMRVNPNVSESVRHFYKQVSKQSPRAWPADLQARFWAGYDRELTEEGIPPRKSNAVAYQEASENFSQFYFDCAQNAELLQAFTEHANKGGKGDTEQENSNDVQ